MIKSFMIAALSADGYIARTENDFSMSWTSKEDRHFFKERTKEAGVVVMGSRTFETIGKPLPDRLNVVYSRSKKSYAGTEVTNKEPRELLAELATRGFTEVAICGGSSIYTLFAQTRCVNELYLTIEPVLFGNGIRLFNKTLDLPLLLKSSKQLAPHVLLLEYTINNPPK